MKQRLVANICAYVHAVEHPIASEDTTASAEEVARWATRARTKAGAINPVKNGRFLERFERDDSSEK
jgi:hypothetical protein